MVTNALRTRKRFRLARFFEGVTDDTQLNITDVRMRVFIHRADGKAIELDIVAASSDERVVLVEIKNQEETAKPKDVQDFQEKVDVYRMQHPDKGVLAAFLSMGGFTKKAQELCEAHGIGWGTDLGRF